MQRKSLGFISVDFDTTGQLLIIHTGFVKYLRKNGNTTKQCVSCLWTSRKFMIQLGGRSCIIFSLCLVSVRPTILKKNVDNSSGNCTGFCFVFSQWHVNCTFCHFCLKFTSCLLITLRVRLFLCWRIFFVSIEPFWPVSTFSAHFSMLLLSPDVWILWLCWGPR
jgi:hypothetical protein